LQKINAPAFKDIKSAVNDISWAFVNGKSYHLLAIATDACTKLFEINLKSLDEGNINSRNIEILKQFTLSENPSFRLSWNILGTYLSVSEKTNIKIFRCL
jgi:inhibitor of KinA sporulation pathway (predicted exonuclease)